MKPAVPWSVKGVEPDAREAAKRAARSAGMTLGAWLNQKLLESGAAQFGAPTAYGADLVGEFGARPTPRPEPSPAQGPAYTYAQPPSEMATVSHSLDALQRHLKDSDNRSTRTFEQISHALEAVLDKLDQAGERRRGRHDDDGLLGIKSALSDVSQRLSAVETRSAPSADLGNVERSVMEIGRAFEAAAVRSSQRIDQVESSFSKFADRTEHAETRRMDAVRGLERAVTELAVQVDSKAKDQAMVIRETQRDVDELHKSFSAKTSDIGLGESRLSNAVDGLQTRISDLAMQVEVSRKSLNKMVTEKDLSKLERRLTEATARATAEVLDRATATAITPQDLAALEGRMQETASRAITTQDLATLEGRMAGAAKATVQEAVRALQSGLRDELLERLDAAEARSASAIQKIQLEAEQARLSNTPNGDLGQQLGAQLQEIAARLDGMATEFDTRLETHSNATRTELEALRNQLAGAPAPVAARPSQTQVQQPAPQPAVTETARGPVVPPPPTTNRTPQPATAQPRQGAATAPTDPNDYMAAARAAVRENQGKAFVAERPDAAQHPRKKIRLGYILFFVIVSVVSVTIGGYSVWNREQLRQDLNSDSVYDPNVQGSRSGIDSSTEEPMGAETGATIEIIERPENQSNINRSNIDAASTDADPSQPSETLQSRTSASEIQSTPARTEPQTPLPTDRVVEPQVAAVAAPVIARPVTTQPAAPSAQDIYARAAVLLENQSPTNDRSAAQQLRTAADQGLTIAQYRLATLYETGRGVGQDENLARAWYTQAAEGGNVRAMHNLAVIHAEGVNGGQPNFEEAARWFAEAASFGIRDSQFNLAVLFERGLGVRGDVNQAYLWYSIAEAGGDPEAGTRRTVLAHQIEDGVQRQIDSAVSSWQPRPVDAAANGRLTSTRSTPSNSASLAEIARAQQLLTAIGYAPGPPDGLMGPRTADTIRQFEITAGMTVTGRVSAALITRLEAELSARANGG